MASAETTTTKVPAAVQQAMIAYVNAKGRNLDPKEFKEFFDRVAKENNFDATITEEAAKSNVDAIKAGARYGGVRPLERDLIPVERSADEGGGGSAVPFDVTRGQTLSTYHPRLTEQVYDYLNRPLELFYNAWPNIYNDPYRERYDYQNSRKLGEGIEALFHPEGMSRVFRGVGNAEDYINTAFNLAPFVPAPLRNAGRRVVGGLVDAVTPDIVRRGFGALGDFGESVGKAATSALKRTPLRGLFNDKQALERYVYENYLPYQTLDIAPSNVSYNIFAPEASNAVSRVVTPEASSLRVQPDFSVPSPASLRSAGSNLSVTPRQVVDRSPASPGLTPGQSIAANAVRPDIAPLNVDATPALPAPPQPLGLPAPGPGLPDFAVKPRGGQWWVDYPYTHNLNNSPEAMARDAASVLSLTHWVPEDVPLPPGDAEQRLRRAMFEPLVPQVETTPEQAWLERALTKYLKNDFGTPEDPLRDLAARGLHYDPEMTPERWQDIAKNAITVEKIGDITLPENLYRKDAYPLAVDDKYAQEARRAMPWLPKLPVTDELYGIRPNELNLDQFSFDFQDALNPVASGIPMDLAVRPESLGRMTFPQAVERVANIRQWRVKKAEEDALADMIANQNNPAVVPFKEYADDPSGMRWVEIKMPEAAEGIHPEDAVRQALEREGKILDICVGDPSQPFCRNVIQGKSRIFSLRDAEGIPHVTIETQPRLIPNNEERNALYDQAISEVEARDIGDPNTEERQINERFKELLDMKRAEIAANPPPEEIIQIKGRKNRAPKDEHLPFVQDFVKSQQWGNVGDFKNTGLVRLPDGRYITRQQAEEGIAAIPETTTMQRAYGSNEMVPTRQVYDPTTLHYLDPEEWIGIAPYFQGYAIGGRVSPDRCFCHNPLSVKKGR